MTIGIPSRTILFRNYRTRTNGLIKSDPDGSTSDRLSVSLISPVKQNGNTIPCPRLQSMNIKICRDLPVGNSQQPQ
jgi:hypothetical protein